MPIELSTGVTPTAKRRFARVVWSRQISRADAQAYVDSVSVGGRYHGWPIVTLTTRDSELGYEARALLSQASTTTHAVPQAIVYAGTVMRVVLGQILKPATRSFKSESSAVRWIEET
jgi:hypothetical protein